MKRHGLEKTDIRNDQMYGLRMGYGVFINDFIPTKQGAQVEKYDARLRITAEGTGKKRILILNNTS